MGDRDRRLATYGSDGQARGRCLDNRRPRGDGPV